MKDRYYPIQTVKGLQHYISVTSVLAIKNNPALNQWRANMGAEASEQYSEETASIGSEIHRYAAKILLGYRIGNTEWAQLDEQIKNGLRALQRFVTDAGFIAYECEKIVWSERYEYAGTLDCIGRAYGKKCVLDWKSGSNFYSSYLAQVASYSKALNDRKVKQLYVVNLNRETGIPLIHSVETRNSKPYWDYFKACLNLVRKDEQLMELAKRGYKNTPATSKGQQEAYNGTL